MTGDSGLEGRWQIGDQWKSRYCPRQQITRETREWLRLYSLYKNGILMVAGGALDQPAIYIAAMTRIESLVNEATTPNGREG